MAIFSSYTVSIRGNGGVGELGIRAHITLWEDKKVAGRIFCWEPGIAMPNDIQQDPPAMNVPVDMLPAIVDLLRHEGRMQIEYKPSLARTHIWTYDIEPVGEDET